MKKLLITILLVSTLIFLSGCDIFNKNETKEENKEENNIIEKEENKEEQQEINEEISQSGSDFKIDDNYLIDTRTNTKYDIYGEFQSVVYDSGYVNGLYFIHGEKGYGIYSKNDNYFIEPIYQDVSCMGHTGEDAFVCDSSDTTILTSENNMKLISLKDGKVLIDGDKIHEFTNGKFVVKKGNNEFIYDQNGKELLKGSYIGYSRKIGYIVINNDKFEVYNEEFNKINLPDINEEINVELNDNSPFANGYTILKLNINDNKYIKYNGNSYSGTKIVLTDICEKGNTYILENNNFIKLNDIEYIGYLNNGCR